MSKNKVIAYLELEYNPELDDYDVHMKPFGENIVSFEVDAAGTLPEWFQDLELKNKNFRGLYELEYITEWRQDHVDGMPYREPYEVLSGFTSIKPAQSYEEYLHDEAMQAFQPELRNMLSRGQAMEMAIQLVNLMVKEYGGLDETK